MLVVVVVVVFIEGALEPLFLLRSLHRGDRGGEVVEEKDDGLAMRCQRR